MKKRIECYCCKPSDLDLHCPKCKGDNITWSEWEEYIWCYDCKKDVKYKPGLSGPIPVQIAGLIGIDLRKYNVQTGKIVPDSDPLNDK